MSIPGNGANRCNYGCVHYRPSGYPVSTGSVQPADQQWDNFSPPPAYETIDRLPIWNEENLHLSTPRTTEIWIRRSETNVPSMSQELHTPSNFQQTSSLQFNTPSTFPELSGLYALSQPNSYTVEPQTIDFKQQFRRFRPRVLGIVLIILSILEISLGISLAVSLYKHDLKSLLFGTLFWVPGIQMFAGTMLIVSWAKTSICSVKCVLCISFLSFIASVIGLIFNSCDLNDMLCISHFHPIVCRIIFEKDFNIYCCLIALNILALLLSFFASCIGNMTLGLKTRSPHPYAITSMPR
ncbi:uncharacterized protein LOC143768952 isoform X1 [Ranitomeya variabilis]|uniref:uncharacterized protein LOC143768952 isoform X1 n=1 Tax=Ranitomeya variabilis TaxID=490064 RepID=UPI004055FF63